VAALDLEHEHALAGHHTEEVDLAFEPAVVVGDVERVEDGPVGMTAVSGEALEDEPFAFGGLVGGDRRRDQVGRGQSVRGKLWCV
jgi:hypothetical protein